MINTIREKILGFIASDKDVPMLAGFSVGIYMLVFYYSRNMSLANSWEQFLFFSCYYILLPVATLLAGYKILKVLKLGNYGKAFLFAGTIILFSFFLLQIQQHWLHKKIILGVIVLLTVGLSFRIGRYYKIPVLLFYLMAAFNLPSIAGYALIAVNKDDAWKNQPDGILDIKFKSKPNIYYIQPDGYTSFNNLKDSIHNFDNSAYESFLTENGFSLYEDYRSNYPTTLLSNSATFSMAHHYIAEDVESYSAREIIMGYNPVLAILAKNGYRTNFISESPYLLMNRPSLAYDFSNINYADIPYIGDGGSELRDVLSDFRKQMAKNRKESNFYFLEKFTPSHIANNSPQSAGRDEEKKAYLSRIEAANKWLTEVISYITRNDKDGIIIIGADHGGFAGFEYMGQSETLTSNPLLARSAFGAQLSIKWSRSTAEGYDIGLASGINLFRTVFAFLAKDKQYLDNLQEDGSYIRLNQPTGIYRYIDASGKVVFDKTNFDD